MLQDVIELLRCPHCGGPLDLERPVARCAAGHSFDVARQGYLNLLPGDARTGKADTAAMVRHAPPSSDAGHYAAIAERSGRRQAARAETRATERSSISAQERATTSRRCSTACPRAHGLALDVSKQALRVPRRAPIRASARSAATPGQDFRCATGSRRWR